jgi:small subunit ribosomal protein S8
MSDPVADMLTRIRNANALMNAVVSLPSTSVKVQIVEVLKREGFINGFEIVEKPLQNQLVIHLRYGPEGERVIRNIKRVSKPGCRVYRPVDELPKVMNGQGIVIVSTNAGVLSDRECREKNVGGEVICQIY